MSASAQPTTPDRMSGEAGGGEAPLPENEPRGRTGQSGNGFDNLPTWLSHAFLRWLTRTPAPTFFNEASHVSIGLLNITSSLGGDPNESEGWKTLIGKSVSSALPNAISRHDPPRTDPGTCDNLIEEIVGWIKDPGSPKSVLCLTGPAAVGKTAVQQMVSERCTKEGIVVSSFFFSYNDPKRNSATELASTIAYQLGVEDDVLKTLMAIRVQNDFHIFQKTPKDQVKALVIDPMKLLWSSSGGAPLIPVAILLDGFDECRADAQLQVLEVIKILSSQGGRAPFRVVFSSRPDEPIRRALEPGSTLSGSVCHLRLDEDYNAQRDVRRTLERRLCDLEVPPVDEIDLEMVVDAACESYQYAHLATILRYLKSRDIPPTEAWKIIVNWTRTEGGQSALPMMRLDPLHRLYEKILSAASDACRVTRSGGPPFMLLLMAYASFPRYNISPYTYISRCAQDLILGLEKGTCRELTKDIHCLVKLTTPIKGPAARWEPLVEFYHKSCVDFVYNRQLSRNLHVTTPSIQHYLVTAFLRYFVRHADEAILALNDNYPPRTVTFLTHMSIWHMATILKPRGCEPDTELISKVFPSFSEFTRDRGWGKLAQWLSATRLRSTVPTFLSTAYKLQDALGAVLQEDLRGWEDRPGSLLIKKSIQEFHFRLPELVKGGCR